MSGTVLRVSTSTMPTTRAARWPEHRANNRRPDRQADAPARRRLQNNERAERNRQKRADRHAGKTPVAHEHHRGPGCHAGGHVHTPASDAAPRPWQRGRRPVADANRDRHHQYLSTITLSSSLASPCRPIPGRADGQHDKSGGDGHHRSQGEPRPPAENLTQPPPCADASWWTITGNGTVLGWPVRC